MELQLAGGQRCRVAAGDRRPVSRRLGPDAERPLQLGIGGAFCGSPEGEPWTDPKAGPADPKADDPAEAEPDIAALPRKKVRVGCPCGPTRPVVTHWPDPASCPSGSILRLPFGSGAPHGVVGEFYARSARPRKGFLERILRTSSTHRFVHRSPRLRPQHVPRFVHNGCEQPRSVAARVALRLYGT